jgi:hypothetical protein
VNDDERLIWGKYLAVVANSRRQELEALCARAPDDVTDRIRVGTRTYRVFWFKPDRLEKMLREFVLDYEYCNLYERIGLPKPEPVTDVTDSREGSNITISVVDEDTAAKETLPSIPSDALNQHQLGEWVHAVDEKEADNIDRDTPLPPDLRARDSTSKRKL